MKVGAKRMLLVGVAAVVLLAALSLQFLRPTTATAQGSARVEGLLAESLPRGFTGGWTGRDLPLGDTELLRQRTEGILQYDDYVYRSFSRNGLEFAVYCAYWRPGKMPTRLVSLHTPDRCWIENGWLCLESRNREAKLFSGGLPAAEWRIFSPPNGTGKIHVAFWLMVDGEAYDFGTGLNTIPNPARWWANFVHEARGGQADHLFVRITSDRPLEDLKRDPMWPDLIAALRQLGLGPRATRS